MKRMLWCFSLICGLFFANLGFADCEDLIGDAIRWASQRDGRYQYRVGFQLSSVKATAKFVHQSEGAFLAMDGTLRAEKVQAAFSDRSWCPELSPGSFCVPYQKFDHRRQDEMTLTIFDTGTMRVVLNTWGNATYNIKLQCSRGFLYGVLTEPNGNSFVTLSLNKTRIDIPR